MQKIKELRTKTLEEKAVNDIVPTRSDLTQLFLFDQDLYKSDTGNTLKEKYPGEPGLFFINNIANIALISSSLNKKISNKNPSVYLKEYENVPNFFEIMETHLINKSMINDLKNERYEEFLVKRIYM